MLMTDAHHGGNGKAAPREHQVPRYRLLTGDDVSLLPPIQWRIKGVLPAQGLAVIYGPPSCGKSFLALDMLAAVAGGKTWFGGKTYPCPVTYVGLEGEHGIAQRVMAYRIARGGVPDDMRFVLRGEFSLLSRRDVHELASSIASADFAAGVTVIDTLNRAALGVDENNSEDMGRVIAGCRLLEKLLGGLVVLVHHSGKDATKGMRGHSSLLAAIDCAIEVRRDQDRREWSVAKSKDGSDGDPRAFRLEVVEVDDPDEDGDAPTSCVVRPTEQDVDRARQRRLPQGGNQRIMWDTIGEMLQASKYFGQGGAPAYRPCVRLEDVVDRGRGRLTTEPRRALDRARAAITGLITRGILVHNDGWLWIP